MHPTQRFSPRMRNILNRNTIFKRKSGNPTIQETVDALARRYLLPVLESNFGQKTDDLYATLLLFRNLVSELSDEEDEIKDAFASIGEELVIEQPENHPILGKRIPKELLCRSTLTRLSQISEEKRRDFFNHLFFAECPHEINLESGVFNRLQDVQESLQLDEIETQLVLIAFVANQHNSFSGNLSIFRKWFDAANAFVNLDLMLGVPMDDIHNALRKGRVLTDLELICWKNKYSTLIDEGLESYLMGTNGESFFDTQLEPIDTTELEKHDSTISPQDFYNIEALMRLGHERTRILFYGTPGVGKSTAAKKLVVASGVSAYQCKISKDNSTSRIDLIRRGLRLIETKGHGILIIDEADNILATEHFFAPPRTDGGKAVINQIFDHYRGKLLMISNETRGMASSVKRRFDYVVHFKPLTESERRRALRTVIRRIGVKGISSASIESWVARYNLPPSVFESAINNAHMLQMSHAKATKLIQRILESQAQFMNLLNHNPAHTGLSHKDVYDSSFITSDVPVDKILTRIARFKIDLARKTPEHPEIRNLNVLLAGVPGAGKTEFVKHAAQKLEMPLVIKRGSDLISKYVGETEKNLAEAFAEAQSQNAILFIDEADSFFQDRSTAVRNWEVTQVNEILCQMEQFRGILICATNSQQSFDPASLRRFAIKATFGYLTADNIIRLAQKSLKRLGLEESIAPEEEFQLRSLTRLTPGEFRVCLQQCLISETKTSKTEFIAMLVRENEMKEKREGRTIGFGG